MNRAVSKTVYKVSDFLSWQKSKSLVLSPSFQRRSVWQKSAKSYLIDTVIREFPIPIIFVREKTDLSTLEPVREVVDGQQRLRTLLSFVAPQTLSDYGDTDAFTIDARHNKELAGKTFANLSPDVRKQILNYDFSVHILASDTDDREVLQIFARMNSTGVKLNSQELRNAEFFGEFKQVAYRLAYEQLNRWRVWKVFSEMEIARMNEVEETSDLMISMLPSVGVHEKIQSNVGKFYERFDEEFDSKEEITIRFRAVMDKIDEISGETLHVTEFRRSTLFHTLFTFVYDLMFGLKSDLVHKRPNQVVNSLVRQTIVDTSQLIAYGSLSEELAKRLRGATASLVSREARFNFLKDTYQQLLGAKS